MVAASRLKRAQEAAENARPYAEKMEAMMVSILENYGTTDGAPKLLAGTMSEERHLLIVIASDRGLCGGFNTNICREVRNRARNLQANGKFVTLLCVGRKGRDQLKTEFGKIFSNSCFNTGCLEKEREVTFILALGCVILQPCSLSQHHAKTFAQFLLNRDG